MPPAYPDFSAVLTALGAAGVRFVVIGGVAMAVHGSAHVTTDIDLCYARDSANLGALAASLAPHKPSLRGVPEDVPFLWDARTLRSMVNFTLRTDIGDVDLLGDPPGAPGFDILWERAIPFEINGVRVRVASLDDLIAMKRAANRPKDQGHVMELEALRKLTRAGESPDGRAG